MMKAEEIQEKAEEAFLKKCDFNDECDLCEHPEKGTYCRATTGGEYDDDYYWVCGKCVEEIINKNPTAKEVYLLIQIDMEREKAIRENRITKSGQLPL